MLKVLEEFWKKYKKIILVLIYIILGIFILNFIFVITDWIAGKGFNGYAIIYSPVSNEEWLSFIGNGIVGLATLLLFWIAKKSFENERNKVKYENKKKKLEKEMEVVEEYLSVFEVNNIYKLMEKFLKSSFLESFDGDEKVVENFTLQKEKILKDINFAQLKLDFRTDLRIVLRGKLKSEKYQKEKNERYNELVDLHNMYGIILKDIFNKAGDLIKIQDLEERKVKISLISSLSDKVKSEIKDEFLKIFSKYEKYLKEDLDRNLNGKNLQMEIEYGRFSVIFNVYLNYVINKIKEYFVNIEKDIEEELL
jgi:DHH family protein